MCAEYDLYENSSTATCPSCRSSVSSSLINDHLDECLERHCETEAHVVTSFKTITEGNREIIEID
jgi:hypothetical protein